MPIIPGKDCELSEKYSDLTCPSGRVATTLVPDGTWGSTAVTGTTVGISEAPVVTGVAAVVTVKPPGSSYKSDKYHICKNPISVLQIWMAFNALNGASLL
jgi:hypothetical protein